MQQRQETSSSSSIDIRTDFDKITDQIPEPTPVGIVEGTAYSLVSFVAFGVVAALLLAVAGNLLYEPKEVTCFNVTLEKLRNDPRVTVRLG